MPSLQIHEIYDSIQGESTYVGWPCTFVRLAGCPLRCRWCDTSYAFGEGRTMELDDIVREVVTRRQPTVELTGGEPLAQIHANDLLRGLVDAVRGTSKVLLETSGAEPIDHVPPEVHIVMDIKCPDSRMSDRNLWSNLQHLKGSDDIKFVIASRADFEWALHEIRTRPMTGQVLMSPAFGLVKPEMLADWVRDETKGLRVRMQLQIHKYIWSPTRRGV